MVSVRDAKGKKTKETGMREKLDRFWKDSFSNDISQPLRFQRKEHVKATYSRPDTE